MKKLFLALGILAICITSISQEIQHEAVAINIEVPVRVFKGDTFIDNLTINDFEVYEDWVSQVVDAVYLVKKNKIAREETKQVQPVSRIELAPQVESRLFVLYFEIIDWTFKIGEVIDYFFNDVIAPSDGLIAVTPMQAYELTSEIQGSKSKEEIAEELKNRLKTDTILAYAEYKSIVRDMTDGVGNEYEAGRLLKRTLRFLDASKLIEFGNYLKNIEGRKHVFLFIQQGLLPSLTEGTLQQRIALDIKTRGLRLDESSIKVTFDANKLKQAFSDSLITAHFLFLTHRGLTHHELKRMRVEYNESQDSNIYDAFSEVSMATGGLRESSFNPMPVFKKTVEASENYYLLYYTPKDYKSDGKFRNCKRQ